MELIGPIHQRKDQREEADLVSMPLADDSLVATFLRYHVLVRVYDGDVDAWLAQLTADGGDPGDVRFVRSVRVRMRREPHLIESIRRMVDLTPFWQSAEA
jgi:hypothetical protein